jgi:hypothetical protein
MWIHAVVFGPGERKAIVNMDDRERLGREQPAMHVE